MTIGAPPKVYDHKKKFFSEKESRNKDSGKLKGTVGAIEDRILQNKGGHH